MSKAEPDPGSAKGFMQSTVTANTFILLRLAPPILFLVLGLTGQSFILSAIAILLLILADFYLTKSCFGLELVGLRWQIDPTEAPQFPHVTFYSRPFPFVASTTDSNIFWLFLVTGTILYFTLFAVFAILGRLGWVLLSLFATALNVITITAFMRCHQVSRAQADSVARTLLLDTSVTMFQAAKEPTQESSSSSDYSDPV